MFKYFNEIADDGSTTTVAINTAKLACAVPGQKENETILRFENGGWFVVEGSQLDIVARLNTKE